MKTKLFLKKALLAVLFAGLTIALARPLKGRAEMRTQEAPPSTSPDEMQATWDAFFEQGLEDFSVHGAVMVAVRGNEIVFSKGYGLADAASQMPFDPERTILRSGSIAKTLTATAIFQLAEQGKLDLDADINNYLSGYKVPDTFPEPVTARHLVNMTGGFDTRAFGIRAASLETILPLETYLKDHMPRRVLPPGRYRRYNDHELVLAGYLVQAISGIPYEEYVRRNIFEPLEMNDSIVFLPDEQLPRAARGYPVGGGAMDAYPLNYYYLNTAPGAGFNTTAEDIGRYMIAHLQLGRYETGSGETRRILEEATAREMLSTGFAYHPKLWAQVSSFDEMFYNGQRYLRKSGGAPGMQNSLFLLPSAGMGFYLFTNTDGFGLRNAWNQKVLETYLPGKESAPVEAGQTPANPPAISAANYTGSYLEVSDQTSDDTIVMMQALIDPDLWREVKAGPNGGLLISNAQYTAVDEVLFNNPKSGSYSVFELDENGKAQYLLQTRTPYKRMSWIKTPTVHLALLGLALVVFLAGVVAVAVRLLRRRSPAGLLAGLVSGLNLLFLVGFVLVMLPLATGADKWQFTLAPSLALRAVLAVPVLSGLISLGLVVQNVNDWRGKRTGRAMLLLNSLVLVGEASFLFFLHTWNLLGWRF